MLCVRSHQKRFFLYNPSLVGYFSLFPFKFKKFWWSTSQTSLCVYFLIENSFSEVDLIRETLHIFNIAHLMSWDICVHQWNHPCSQGIRHIHHLQKFSYASPSLLVVFTPPWDQYHLTFNIVSYVAQLSGACETETLYPLNNTSPLELSKF